MNVFQHMVSQLQTPNTYHGVCVNRADYAIFCREFIFDKLRGIAFGKSFCNRFNINDHVLNVMHDEQYARWHVETFWLANEN